MTKFDRNPDTLLSQSLFASGRLLWPLYSHKISRFRGRGDFDTTEPSGWRRTDWRDPTSFSYTFSYTLNRNKDVSAVSSRRTDFLAASGILATILFQPQH